LVSGVAFKACDEGDAAALCPSGAGSSSNGQYGTVYCCSSDNCNSAETVSASTKFILVSSALSVQVGLFGTRF
jgi:hypothetical protein